MTQGETDPAIAQTAMQYYTAMVSGDAPALRSLFEPRAPRVGHFEGEFLWQDVDSFIAETESLVGQHGKHDCTIENVRQDGDIATVAVRGRYLGQWFVDHLSLLRIETGWIIVAKTFWVVAQAR